MSLKLCSKLDIVIKIKMDFCLSWNFAKKKKCVERDFSLEYKILFFGQLYLDTYR